MSPKVICGFKPVVLTSLTVVDSLDPLQFAYRNKRRVDDAALTLLNLIFKHLEGPGTHAHLLFLNFSLAFNTIQPHILANKLLSNFNFQVQCYKYLGTITDNKLTLNDNTVAICKKAQQLLHFFQKLHWFGVCSKLIMLSYSTMVVSHQLLYYFVW